MSTVKCVFKCIQRPEGSTGEVVFEPRYSDDQGNRVLNGFAQATPSGRLTLHCDNPAAMEHFKQGAYYDIDITERPAPTA